MRNIILVLIDGARYTFAAENKLYREIFSSSDWYERVYTACPYTIGSMHALFTGQYPKNNGVNGYFRANDLKKSVNIIPQYLKDAGYYSVCNIPSPVVMADRGFDIYELHDEYNEDVASNHFRFLIREADSIFRKSPFFLYLHYSKIHTSLANNVLKKYDDFSEEYFSMQNENRIRYQNDIDMSAAYLDELVVMIKQKGLFNNTDIWVMSDHGASLGEITGERAYGVFLYDYTLHTFLAKISDRTEGMRDRGMHSTVDILPMVFESAGVEIPKGIDGMCRRVFDKGSIFKKGRKDYIFAETGGVGGPFPSPEKHNMFCIMDEKVKLIHNRSIDSFEQLIMKDGEEVADTQIDADMKKQLQNYENEQT